MPLVDRMAAILGLPNLWLTPVHRVKLNPVGNHFADHVIRIIRTRKNRLKHIVPHRLFDLGVLQYLGTTLDLKP